MPLPQHDFGLSDDRLGELDGLRGWASLSVLLFHVFWETFGSVVPEFRNPLTGGLFNGALSVSIFFVLSGEALSAAYWRNGDRLSVARMAVKRYPRLTIPIICSCLMVFVLMKLGLVYSAEAAVIVVRADWLGSFLNFPPDWQHFIRYSLIDVYVDPSAATAYNPFLWTMQTEIVGSFFVFVVLLVERHLARFGSSIPVALVVGLAVAFFLQKSLVACFMFGVLFGLMHARGHFERLRAIAWVRALAVLMLVTALAFSSHKQFAGHSGARPFTIAATCFVFFIHCHPTCTMFLRHNRASRLLGRLSFPLYLVHFPVIVSLTSFLIVVAAREDSLNAATAGAIAALTVAASIAAAALFMPVESLTQGTCRWLSRLLPPRRVVQGNA